MSATLIDDAALIRDFAADPRSIEEPIKPKVGGYIGERLIVTPQLVDSSIDELTTIELVSRVSALHEANVVVLVPSNKRASIWKTDSSMEVTGTNISEVIERLACSSPNTAIIANRYDGIDLPDEACRVLVIDNLPQEDRLANLIEATVRRQSPFLKRQMAQRIEQGMGRGVRSIADYCVVVLMGRELVAFMTDVKNQAFLTEETKRQVEMGKGLSSMLKQSTNTSQAIMDLIAQCLDRDPDWQKFHRESLQDTETAKASDSDTVALATAELRAFKCAFGGQYDRAADEIGCLISERNGLSDNDTGWYLQLQAEYLHHVDPVTALEKQLKAQELNRNLLKPPDGINYRRIQSKATDQAYAVVEWATQSNEPNALVARAGVVLDSLSFGVSHETFEKALSDLVEIVGFQGQRPEKETGRGPDVLWRMTDGHHLIIEAKNQVDLQRESIFKKEAEQLGHHVTWFKEEYSGEPYTPIMIHPSATLAREAYLPPNAKVVQQIDLQRIVESVRAFVATLATKHSSQWSVLEVAAQLQARQLRPADFLSRRLVRGAVRQT